MNNNNDLHILLESIINTIEKITIDIRIMQEQIKKIGEKLK